MDKINKIRTDRIIKIDWKKISFPARLLNILFMEKEWFLIDQFDDMKLAWIGWGLWEKISTEKLYMDSSYNALDAVGKNPIKIWIWIFIKWVTKISEYHRNINFDKIDKQLEFFKIWKDAIFFFNYKNVFEEKSIKLVRIKDIFDDEWKIWEFKNSNVYHWMIKHSSKFLWKIWNWTNIGEIMEIKQFYDILSLMMNGWNTWIFSKEDIEKSNLLKLIIDDIWVDNDLETNISNVEIAFDMNSKGNSGFFIKKKFLHPSKYDINWCEISHNFSSKWHLNITKPTALSLVITEDIVNNILLWKTTNDIFIPSSLWVSKTITQWTSTFQEVAFYLAAHNTLGSKELKEKIQLLEDRFIERSKLLFNENILTNTAKHNDKYEQSSFVRFLKPLK